MPTDNTNFSSEQIKRDKEGQKAGKIHFFFFFFTDF